MSTKLVKIGDVMRTRYDKLVLSNQNRPDREFELAVANISIDRVKPTGH